MDMIFVVTSSSNNELLSQGQIEGDRNYNFISKYEEDNEVISQNMHSCKYYEMEEISKLC